MPYPYKVTQLMCGLKPHPRTQETKTLRGGEVGGGNLYKPPGDSDA